MRRKLAKAAVLGLSAVNIAGYMDMAVYAAEAVDEANSSDTADVAEATDATDEVSTDVDSTEYSDDALAPSTDSISESAQEAEASLEEIEEATTEASDSAIAAETDSQEAVDAVENNTKSEASNVIATAEASVSEAQDKFDDAQSTYNEKKAAYENARDAYEEAVSQYNADKAATEEELAAQQQKVADLEAQLAAMEEAANQAQKSLADAGANALVTAEDNKTIDQTGYISAVIEHYYLSEKVSLPSGQTYSNVQISSPVTFEDDSTKNYVTVTYDVIDEKGQVVDSVSTNLGYSISDSDVQIFTKAVKYEYQDGDSTVSMSGEEMEKAVDEGNVVKRYLYNGSYYTKEGLANLNLSEDELSNIEYTYVVLGDYGDATVEGKEHETTTYEFDGKETEAVAVDEVDDDTKDSTTVCYFDANGNYVRVVTNYTTKYVYTYVNGKSIKQEGFKSQADAQAAAQKALSSYEDIVAKTVDINTYWTVSGSYVPRYQKTGRVWTENIRGQIDPYNYGINKSREYMYAKYSWGNGYANTEIELSNHQGYEYNGAYKVESDYRATFNKKDKRGNLISYNINPLIAQNQYNSATEARNAALAQIYKDKAGATGYETVIGIQPGYDYINVQQEYGFIADYVYRNTTTSADSYTETSTNNSKDAVAFLRNVDEVANTSSDDYKNYVSGLRQQIAEYDQLLKDITQAKADIDAAKARVQQLQKKLDSYENVDSNIAIARVAEWEAKLSDAQNDLESSRDSLAKAKENLSLAKERFAAKYPVITPVDVVETAVPSTTTSDLEEEKAKETEELEEEEEIEEDDEIEITDEDVPLGGGDHYQGDGWSTADTSEYVPDTPPVDVADIAPTPESEEEEKGITFEGLLEHAGWGVVVATPAVGLGAIVAIEAKKKAAEAAAEIFFKK